MRIFLDANILFSATKSDGSVHALLRLVRDAAHECRADHYVVIQAHPNLATNSRDGVTAIEVLHAPLHIGFMPTPRSAAGALDWLPETDRLCWPQR